jgi:hypothetical protein
MTEENTNDKPKPGQGSILEGTLDLSEDNKAKLGFLCNVIFGGMSLQMCNMLVAGIGAQLNGPLLSNDLASMASTPAVSLARNTIAGPSGMSAPAFPTPKMGGGMFG